jgi:hypothetical protein
MFIAFPALISFTCIKRRVPGTCLELVKESVSRQICLATTFFCSPSSIRMSKAAAGEAGTYESFVRRSWRFDSLRTAARRYGREFR